MSSNVFNDLGLTSALELRMPGGEVGFLTGEAQGTAQMFGDNRIGSGVAKKNTIRQLDWLRKHGLRK